MNKTYLFEITVKCIRVSQHGRNLSESYNDLHLNKCALHIKNVLWSLYGNKNLKNEVLIV